MSLLNSGPVTVTVFQEVSFVDRDGNTITQPGTEGVTTRAAVQLAAQSGTSARRAEQDNEGFETESVYRLRLPKNFPFILGAQAAVEWEGRRYGVMGDARRYNGSRRTSHIDYMIKRT